MEMAAVLENAERLFGSWEGPQLPRIEPPATPEEGYHLTEDLTDHAVSWMRQQKALPPARLDELEERWAAASLHEAADGTLWVGDDALPGAVDAHQHWGIYNPLDVDAVSESRAAAQGGVTTGITDLLASAFTWPLARPVAATPWTKPTSSSWCRSSPTCRSRRN